MAGENTKKGAKMGGKQQHTGYVPGDHLSSLDYYPSAQSKDSKVK
jgi:hypothetical protein